MDLRPVASLTAFGLGWRSAVATAAIAFASAACGKGDRASPAPAASNTAITSAKGTTTAVLPVGPVARKPGEMPFEFPSVATAAQRGDSILAPSKTSIDEAFGKPDRQTFTYSAARMLEPGAVASRIKPAVGDSVTVPNAFIIAIKRAQKVKPGDVVLTSSSSGSGMTRSIIVGGGSPEEPRAIHLDVEIDSGNVPKKEDTLKKGMFHRLGNSLEPGVTVVEKDGGSFRQAIVIAVSGDKVLTLGFAGTVKVAKKGEYTALAPAGSFVAGKEVAVPKYGSYTNGKIDHVDARAGRVYVKFPHDTVLTAAGIVDVSPPLSGP